MNKTLGTFLLTIFLSGLSVTAYAGFECYAGDGGGHLWKSTGSTEDRATAVAMSFCTGYSPDSGSCQVKRCKSI